ncbi:Hypothetical_protein [Hexamita inflata]|uniref:Hypothetical_protein n=1 Tax=Hexamita inflata TaxID=28002 RepID=A0AA86R7C5_9EUKA|nr:Hypothetical protein HINF_LOCUS58422 [Hexamita inflata]
MCDLDQFSYFYSKVLLRRKNIASSECYSDIGKDLTVVQLVSQVAAHPMLWSENRKQLLNSSAITLQKQIKNSKCEIFKSVYSSCQMNQIFNRTYKNQRYCIMEQLHDYFLCLMARIGASV